MSIGKIGILIEIEQIRIRPSRGRKNRNWKCCQQILMVAYVHLEYSINQFSGESKGRGERGERVFFLLFLLFKFFFNNLSKYPPKKYGEIFFPKNKMPKIRKQMFKIRKNCSFFGKIFFSLKVLGDECPTCFKIITG